MTFHTAYEMQLITGAKAKDRRKTLGYTLKEASERSGVSVKAISKFERTGEISYPKFLMIVAYCGDLSAMPNSFEAPPPIGQDSVLPLSTRPAVYRHDIWSLREAEQAKQIKQTPNSEPQELTKGELLVIKAMFGVAKQGSASGFLKDLKADPEVSDEDSLLRGID